MYSYLYRDLCTEQLWFKKPTKITSFLRVYKNIFADYFTLILTIAEREISWVESVAFELIIL